MLRRRCQGLPHRDEGTRPFRECHRCTDACESWMASVPRLFCACVRWRVLSWAGPAGDMTSLVLFLQSRSLSRCTDFPRCAEIFLGLGPKTCVAFSCSEWGLKGDIWGLKTWELYLAPGATNTSNFRSLEFYPFYPMEEETGSSGKGQAQVSENQGSKSHESCIEITVVLYRISLHPPVPRSIPSSCRMLRKPITNPDKRIPGFNGNSEQRTPNVHHFMIVKKKKLIIAH